MGRLSVEYDEAHDVVTIEGVRFTGDLFRAIGTPVHESAVPFVIERDAHGMPTVRTVPMGYFTCAWCVRSVEDPYDEDEDACTRHPVTEYAFRDDDGGLVCKECAKGADDGDRSVLASPGGY